MRNGVRIGLVVWVILAALMACVAGWGAEAERQDNGLAKLSAGRLQRLPNS